VKNGQDLEDCGPMRAVVTRELELVGFVVAIGLLLGAAEWANPFRPAHRNRAETRRHLQWLGIYLIAVPPLTWLISRVLRAITQHTPWRTTVERAPFPLRLAVALVVVELVAYWLHRWMHTVRWLWWLHSVHHAATEVRWWTAFRAHPLSSLVVHLVPFTAVAITGVGADALAAVVAIVIIVSLLAHADVYLPLPALDALVVTPGYHRLHHERRGTGAHFAQVLPVMDRLFGTLQLSPDQREADRQRGDVRAAGCDRGDERVAVAVAHDGPFHDDHCDLDEGERDGRAEQATQQR
jgi:sterol desaturase/sphingolipid hydroxylase (fatty acid hydroxylase superfamily)